jgi:citrate synthase
MGFPTDMFPVLFSIPRTIGWLAHWLEFQNDSENKIARPRQLYKGKMNENYVELKDRTEVKPSELDSTESLIYKRRKVKN